MQKNISRKGFIARLRFYLSFGFEEDESESILNDYEEWFENEVAQGKSEAEICAALEPPVRIVRNLLSESGSRFVRVSVLLRNTVMRILMLITAYYVGSLLIVRACNKNAISYWGFAVGMLFLYFIVGVALIKKSDSAAMDIGRRDFYGSNLLISGLVVALMGAAVFWVPRVSAPDSGVVWGFALRAGVVFLFLISLYTAVKKLPRYRQYAFVTILHAAGGMALLLFLINQSQMLYNGVSEYHNALYDSGVIYAEAVILCLIFYIRRIKVRK